VPANTHHHPLASQHQVCTETNIEHLLLRALVRKRQRPEWASFCLWHRLGITSRKKRLAFGVWRACGERGEHCTVECDIGKHRLSGRGNPLFDNREEKIITLEAALLSALRGFSDRLGQGFVKRSTANYHACAYGHRLLWHIQVTRGPLSWRGAERGEPRYRWGSMLVMMGKPISRRAQRPGILNGHDDDSQKKAVSGCATARIEVGAPLHESPHAASTDRDAGYSESARSHRCPRRFLQSSVHYDHHARKLTTFLMKAHIRLRRGTTAGGLRRRE